MATASLITPKSVREFPEYLNYEWLRSEGIRHIQDLAGNIWTDHNSHDPGITMLEVLCYALTDLGYRTNLDIRDLLAKSSNTVYDSYGEGDENFETAASILSCNPLTILDFRKLLIDIEGVRNAWLVPAEGSDVARLETGLVIDPNTRQLAYTNNGFKKSPLQLEINGLYKVLLELDDAYLAREAAKRHDATGDIIENVRQTLHAHRNLCEDFMSIKILRDEYISLCGEIELAADASPDMVLLLILEKVQEFLSPTIHFYTLKEMLEKGATTDQIFEGRPLRLEGSHGFIDSEMLESIEQRTEIHVTDIYRLILDTEGVVAVKKLNIINRTNGENPEGEKWILPLTPDTYRPVLDAKSSIGSLVFTKRSVAYSVDAETVKRVFDKKLTNSQKVKKTRFDLNLPISLGKYRSDLATHYSIQNDMPSAYSTSKTAFPTVANTPNGRENQAMALQLKGYLLFFDRLMANYLAQLGNLRSLFSSTLDADTDAVATVGSLADVPHLERLLPYDNSLNHPLSIGDYKRGETIAKVVNPTTLKRIFYPNPQARDLALAQIMADFDADNIFEDIKEIKVNDIVYYHFLLKSKRGRQVALLSEKAYKTKLEAKASLGAVRFLATLESSYTRRFVRPAIAHQYTFDWVMELPDFQQISREITENRTAYFKKKNKLFDHLLARFAEDFTDYTLLMFGLHKNSKTQPTEEVFARDKARFIKNYPSISRNRARGFNTLTALPQYWRGENISGIENRLSTLLAFNKRANKQLNFFEITSDDRLRFVFQDRLGNVLLRSPQQLSEAKFDKFKAAVKAIACRPEAYQPFENKAEKVFGFRLIDDQGCVVAVHPHSYSTEHFRDNMMRYTRFVACDNDRFPVHYFAETKGFFPQIQLPNGKIAFKTAESLPTKDAAKRASLSIRKAAKLVGNYEKIHTPNQGYSFVLNYILSENTEGSKTAIHPQFYASESERDTAQKAVFDFFYKNPLQVQVQQLPQRHRWSIATPEGELLESLYFFKTKSQTREAAIKSLKLARKAQNFEIKTEDDGTFTVFLIRHDHYHSEQTDGRIKEEILTLPIARTQAFATAAEADKSIEKIKRLANVLLQKIDNQYVDECHTEVGLLKTETAEGAFFAQLIDENGRVRLKDSRLFEHDKSTKQHYKTDTFTHAYYHSAIDAELGFDAVLEAACAGFWQPESLNNGCAQGFYLKEKSDGKQIAEHPILYPSVGKRDDASAALQNFVCDNQPRLDVEEVRDAWQFELVCPDGFGQLTTILRGLEKDSDKGKMIDFFNNEVRKGLTDFENADKESKDNFIEKQDLIDAFSFVFKTNDGQNKPLAEHPQTYKTLKERDQVIEKLKNCLTKPAENEDGFQTINEFSCACSDEEKRTEDRRRWRVRDAFDRLAIYQLTFLTDSEAVEKLKNLTELYRCKTPQYSYLLVNEAATPNAGLGNWQWVIRGAKNVLWQSPDGFPSMALARADFESKLMRVMSLSTDLNHYRIVPKTDEKTHEKSYSIELLNERLEVVVRSAKPFCTFIEAQKGIARRHRYAQLFPLVKVGQSIGFQLFNTENQDIEWRSAQNYADWQTALAAFQKFVDMLGFEQHLHIIGGTDCGWQIAMTEVLLESPSCFATRIKNKTTDEDAEAFAWRFVEDFVDSYQAADESKLVRYYADEADGGQRYRWQLVGQNYALARHPTAFHTLIEREMARDNLFGLWQNTPQYVANSRILNRLEAADKLTDALRKSLSIFGNLFVVSDNSNKPPFNLGVFDELSGLPTVLAHEYASTDDLIEEVREMYVFLQMDYSVALFDGSFGFEIRSVIGTQSLNLAGLDGITVDLPKYATIWESIKTYKKTADLKADYDQCITLLQDKLHYDRSHAPDNSYTLVIVNPLQVLATNPRRYPSLTACREAAKRALQYVDTEGFHLVEHLLLRPRKKLPAEPQILPKPVEPKQKEGQTDADFQNEKKIYDELKRGYDLAEMKHGFWERYLKTLMPINLGIEETEEKLKAKMNAYMPNKPTEEVYFDNYVVGGDPYSMTATVVLPYWSRRFRSLDFRQFFENTLRRETPAHILLNIVWISPRQMQLFENQWRCWLNTIARPDTFEFVDRTACLVEVLRNLQNTYPMAILSACGDGGAPILLDETTIG